jgi:hypothetical protein
VVGIGNPGFKAILVFETTAYDMADDDRLLRESRVTILIPQLFGVGSTQVATLWASPPKWNDFEAEAKPTASKSDEKTGDPNRPL